MSHPDRILLILGVGPRLGSGVASKFRAGGYRVAMAARSLTDGLTEDGSLNIAADFSDPQNVRRAFEATIQNFGHPSALCTTVSSCWIPTRYGSYVGRRLIISGANRLLTPPDDPLLASLETLAASRTVGLDAGYVAAQEAFKGFRALPAATQTTFIHTGNTLNQIAIPGVLPFALGKVAAAMVIEYAANAYGKDGYRFYYADERQPNGWPVGGEGVGGSTHAEMYWNLAHEGKQLKWLAAFTTIDGKVVRKPYEGVDFWGETRG